MEKCLKYSCEAIIKSGKVWGKQRFRCKNCGYQFTRETKRGHEDKTRHWL